MKAKKHKHHWEFVSKFLETAAYNGTGSTNLFQEYVLLLCQCTKIIKVKVENDAISIFV